MTVTGMKYRRTRASGLRRTPDPAARVNHLRSLLGQVDAFTETYEGFLRSMHDLTGFRFSDRALNVLHGLEDLELELSVQLRDAEELRERR